MGAPPHPPAQLVQLGQPEALGVLDHHERGVRHVDADFDDGGGHQQVHFAVSERLHHGGLFGLRQPAVHQPDAQVRQVHPHALVGVHGRLEFKGFAFLDQRTDPVGLLPAARGLRDVGDDFFAPRVRDQLGQDRRASRRQFVDDGHVQVGKKGHGQGAGNRRGAHVELVRHDAAAHGFALAGERQALPDAEAVLLVDDGQAQAMEFDVVLDQRLRAHDQLHATVGGGRRRRAARLGGEAAAQPGYVHAQRLEPRHQLAEVLLGQDFGRRHQRDLRAAGDGLRRGDGRHHGLAAAHVALQQAMHGVRFGQVGGYLFDHSLLRAGQFERQGFVQPGDQAAGIGARRQRFGFLDAPRRPGRRQRQLLRQ
jgi:hypothetical protein